MTSLLDELAKEWKETEYAVYQYTPNRETLEKKETETSHIVGAGFSLSLIGTSIASDREHLLRAHMGIKLSQGTLYKSSGLVTNMDPDSFPPSSQSYVSRIDAPTAENQDRQFLVCFVFIGKHGLDLFRTELDSFCTSLTPLLKTLPSETTQAFSGSKLEERLKMWHTEHVAYVVRVVQLCQAQLPILLHVAADAPVAVTGEDEGLVRDVTQFLDACSLANLMQLHPADTDTEGGNGSTSAAAINGTAPRTEIRIHVSKDGCEISSKESSKFCQNWAQVLLAQGTTSPDPFFLRQAIENYKLKIIQDVNALKRLLRQAESN